MVNLKPNPTLRVRSACVLGATGSVGIQTLDVLSELGIPAELMTAGEGAERFAPRSLAGICAVDVREQHSAGGVIKDDMVDIKEQKAL